MASSLELMRLNVPPGWPVQWQYGHPIEPSWPSPPPGWVWWSPDSDVPASGASLSQAARAIGWGISAAGVLCVLAAFLPWLSIGLLSVPGTQGDGQITLVLGLIAAGIGLGRGLANRFSGWQIAIPAVSLILAMGVCAVGFYHLVDIRNEPAGPFGIALEPGIGLQLTCLGGLGLLIASVAGLAKFN